LSTNGKAALYDEPSVESDEGHAVIFDIPIALAQPGEMLGRVTRWVGHGGRARRVMYVNAHVLNRSRESLSLRMALEQADLVYCDGYGVRLAAKALEVETPHRMTGADWIWGLASLCEAGGHSIYLLGCDPGIAAGLTVLHAIGLVDRLEGGREAVVAEAPLTTLFTRHDFLPS